MGGAYLILFLLGSVMLAIYFTRRGTLKSANTAPPQEATGLMADFLKARSYADRLWDERDETMTPIREVWLRALEELNSPFVDMVKEFSAITPIQNKPVKGHIYIGHYQHFYNRKMFYRLPVIKRIEYMDYSVGYTVRERGYYAYPADMLLRLDLLTNSANLAVADKAKKILTIWEEKTWELTCAREKEPNDWH